MFQISLLRILHNFRWIPLGGSGTWSVMVSSLVLRIVFRFSLRETCFLFVFLSVASFFFSMTSFSFWGFLKLLWTYKKIFIDPKREKLVF